jgi:hypothetical protein
MQAIFADAPEVPCTILHHEKLLTTSCQPLLCAPLWRENTKRSWPGFARTAEASSGRGRGTSPRANSNSAAGSARPKESSMEIFGAVLTIPRSRPARLADSPNGTNAVVCSSRLFGAAKLNEGLVCSAERRKRTDIIGTMRNHTTFFGCAKHTTGLFTGKPSYYRYPPRPSCQPYRPIKR